VYDLGVRGAAVFTLVLLAIACSPSPAIYCTPDETMCHGSCSALYKDAQNCGGCDIACGAGLVCSEGTCATSCGGGTTQCGSSCVEPFIDRDNCGTCGHACSAGEVCSKGVCGTTCALDQKLCTSIATQPYCANIATDNANCGSCGVHCGGKETCVAGQCVAGCAPEQALCDGTCVNLSSDAAHCGNCNVACAFGAYCINWSCACTDGLTMCTNACVDTTTDKNNCGACGTKCAGTCEGGRCAIVLDYTSSATSALAQDATHVFWTESNGESHQGAKSGPSYLVLATNAWTTSVAVDASNVYWPYGAAIEMAEIGGNSSSEQTMPNAANEVIADGTWVYVADATGIRRFASGGGTVDTIITDTKPHALATTSNGLIFWANAAYQLEVANIDGTSQSTLTTMTSSIDHVVTDGSNVYFAWMDDVLSVPIQTSGPPLVLASGLVPPASLATDGTSVFWVDSGGIWKVPVNGGAKAKIHTSTNDIVEIVVDSTAVYWTSNLAQIGKLTPK
jgi:hypothetical protein